MLNLRSTYLSFFLFLIFLFVNFSVASSQELVEQHPNVFIRDMEDVAMHSSGNGVALSVSGDILLTDNFGENWELQSSSINSIVRIDAIPGTTQSFLLVQRTEIRRTDDGGQNWEVLSLPADYDGERLKRLSLPSNDVYYVVNDTQIMKTNDGGMSWNLLSSPATDVEWTDLFFITEMIGWLSDDTGTLYYTTNGGNSWTIRNNTAFVDEFVFDFLDENTGYAAVFKDLHKTTDGGVTWTLVHANAFGSHMDQVEIIDTENIVFSQTALSNYVTNDGGLTIVQESPLGYGGNHGFLTSLPDGSVWATTDYGGLAYSEDSGVNWTDQLPGDKHGFLAIDFLDSSTGWAAGRQGQIAKTSNGGSNWTIVSGNLPNDPVSEETPYIFHVDSYSGTEAILGASRQIFQTTDGGGSWDVLLEPTEENSSYKSIFSLGSNIWVLQNNGTMYRSNDTGQTWNTSIVEESFTSYEDLFFVNENVGYLAGFNGKLAKTTDGGMSWNQVPEFTEERLQSPFFINELEGWVLIDGYDSSYFHTTDGGESWETVDTENNSFWGDIHVNELGEIYIFGGTSGNGRAIRSLDGGESWELSVNSYVTSFQDYAYIDEGDSYSYWVCGFGGFIGRYDVSLVGTQEAYVQDLRLFPNPSDGVVQMDLPNEWMGKGLLSVYNLSGQLVAQSVAKKRIDLSHLVSGTYICKLQMGSELYIGKLFIEK